MLVVIFVIMVMVGWDSDDNMSFAGLTQESRGLDVTTISSDDKPLDPDENFRLLIEGAHKLSSHISQVSHFDDKVFGVFSTVFKLYGIINGE